MSTQHPVTAQQGMSTQHLGQATGRGAAHSRWVEARRRRVSASLGAIPVANIVVIETGLALGLILVILSGSLLPVAAGIAVFALFIALLRWRGRWFTQWFGLVLEYNFRNHSSVAEAPEPDEAAVYGVDSDESDYPGAVPGYSPSANADESGDQTIIGAESRRISLLRLVLPDLVVAQAQDHERNPVGIAWHDGKWTAVLAVDPTPSMISRVDQSGSQLPLGALTPCLEDRGVVLDAIQVIWHCYPGSATLPPSAPALDAYLEVLGSLPAGARRTTWVAVRLDPKQCAKAIGERGGGIVGAHRALIGALSRVRNALDNEGVSSRPLDPDELLSAGIVSAELQNSLGAQRDVVLQESWKKVTAGHVGHSCFSITGWPRRLDSTLDALAAVRTLSSTVALSIAPSGEDEEVGLRGLVRVSARAPEELAAAEAQLRAASRDLGINLTPLRGLQLAAFSGTLPLGGAA